MTGSLETLGGELTLAEAAEAARGGDFDGAVRLLEQSGGGAGGGGGLARGCHGGSAGDDSGAAGRFGRGGSVGDGSGGAGRSGGGSSAADRAGGAGRSGGGSAGDGSGGGSGRAGEATPVVPGEAVAVVLRGTPRPPRCSEMPRWRWTVAATRGRAAVPVALLRGPAAVNQPAWTSSPGSTPKPGTSTRPMRPGRGCWSWCLVNRRPWRGGGGWRGCGRGGGVGGRCRGGRWRRGRP